MTHIRSLQKSIHAWATRKEWRGPNADPRPLMVDIALFHSEASEALEELRDNADPKHRYYSYEVTVQGVKFKNLSPEQVIVLTGHDHIQLELVGKPEGFGPECADLMIRLLDTAEEYGIDLTYEIDAKMQYNEQRELKHGGKLA